MWWQVPTLHKKWSFPLGISSVIVTESAEDCGFGHIYWRNNQWKNSFFVQCQSATEEANFDICVGKSQKSDLEHSIAKYLLYFILWIYLQSFVQDYLRKHLLISN